MHAKLKEQRHFRVTFCKQLVISEMEGAAAGETGCWLADTSAIGHYLGTWGLKAGVYSPESDELRHFDEGSMGKSR